MSDALPSCPVLKDAEKALKAGQEFNKAMRRLRISQRRCKNCEHGGDCPAIQTVNQQINQAIKELTEEWGLYV